MTSNNSNRIIREIVTNYYIEFVVKLLLFHQSYGEEWAVGLQVSETCTSGDCK